MAAPFTEATPLDEFVRRAVAPRLNLLPGTTAKTVERLAAASLDTIGDTLGLTDGGWAAVPVAFHIKRMLRFALIAVLAPTVPDPSVLVPPAAPTPAPCDPFGGTQPRTYRKAHSFLRPVFGDAGYGAPLEALAHDTPLSARDRRDMAFLAHTLPREAVGTWEEIEWWGGGYASAKAMAAALGRPLFCFVRANLFGEAGGTA